MLVAVIVCLIIRPQVFISVVLHHLALSTEHRASPDIFISCQIFGSSIFFFFTNTGVQVLQVLQHFDWDKANWSSGWRNALF